MSEEKQLSNKDKDFEDFKKMLKENKELSKEDIEFIETIAETEFVLQDQFKTNSAGFENLLKENRELRRIYLFYAISVAKEIPKSGALPAHFALMCLCARLNFEQVYSPPEPTAPWNQTLDSKR